MSLIIKTGIFVLNIIYSAMKLLPQKHKITFISRQISRPSLDITMLDRKLRELHSDYETVILCRTLDPGILNKISYAFHMLKQMYHIATSEAVILDSYCMVISILNHRKKLLVIQMWHSIGTMKKFGYSILDKPEGSSSRIAHLMKMHRNYDYILAAGDGYRDHLAEGFSYPPEKIVTLPLPRVEVLKDREYACRKKEEILSIYPELKYRKNIVYVPTFRKVNDDEFLHALKELCDSVDYSEYNLIIKAHPLTDLSDFDGGKAVRDTCFSSFDMLFISDIVISDYSCIMYEAAVLGKPIYLYAYDFDEYMSTREIYIDYKKEIPCPVCGTAAELMEAVREDGYDYDALDAFLKKYVYMGSRHETEDIISFIFDHISAS